MWQNLENLWRCGLVMEEENGGVEQDSFINPEVRKGYCDTSHTCVCVCVCERERERERERQNMLAAHLCYNMKKDFCCSQRLSLPWFWQRRTSSTLHTSWQEPQLWARFVWCVCWPNKSRFAWQISPLVHSVIMYSEIQVTELLSVYLVSHDWLP